MRKDEIEAKGENASVSNGAVVDTGSYRHPVVESGLVPRADVKAPLGLSGCRNPLNGLKLTPDQVAHILGVTRRQAVTRCRRRQLPWQKVSRLRLILPIEDLEEFMRADGEGSRPRRCRPNER